MRAVFGILFEIHTGADKVPVEAGMINDIEGMSKEAKDLTK